MLYSNARCNYSFKNVLFWTDFEEISLVRQTVSAASHIWQKNKSHHSQAEALPIQIECEHEGHKSPQIYKLFFLNAI